jgi:predicted component of type VI protein secretion system
MNPTLSQQATPADDVLFQEVAGEAVLLNLATENYFGLDEVGTRFWMLLGENPRLQVAFERMSEEYDVPPDRLREDLLALAGKLAQAGLVVIQ